MQEKIEAVRNLLAELHEIKKRPFTAGALDMILWINDKLDLADQLLDELAVELDPAYPDQQLILNHEHEELSV